MFLLLKLLYSYTVLVYFKYFLPQMGWLILPLKSFDVKIRSLSSHCGKPVTTTLIALTAPTKFSVDHVINVSVMTSDMHYPVNIKVTVLAKTLS